MRANIIVAAGQILGPRDEQEDSILVNVGAGLFIMADGMGGHYGGKEASQCAVKSIVGCVENGMDLPAAYEAANEAILTELYQQSEERRPGTTCTSILFNCSPGIEKAFHAAVGMMTLAHTGDSRCYRLRTGFIHDGTEELLTRDHKWGRFLARRLGAPTERYLPPDVIIDSLEYGDRILLCSDGLNGVLEDREIFDILKGQKTPDDVVKALLALNGKTARDNVSVIVIDISPPPPQSAPKRPPVKECRF